MKLIPKNWDKFQHYKDRNPPWIKLHRDLLIDKEFMRLPLASKALAPMLWLLASEDINGVFEANLDQLEFRLRLTQKELNSGLKPLIDNGFFLDASTMLAPCLQDAIPETETETKTDYAQDAFDIFYKSYPKKKSPADAEKAWKSMKPDLDTVLAALKWQTKTHEWTKNNGQFIPYPASYLRARMWENEKPTSNETHPSLRNWI